MSILRFILLVLVKWFSLIFFRTSYISKTHTNHRPWENTRLIILLNHTSLLEPLLSSILPYKFLWGLACNGAFPVADITLNRPIFGRWLKLLAPKVISLTRKKDESWDNFLNQVDHNTRIIFFPEGRMKRKDGFDKHGKAMTLKGGVVDLMAQLKEGNLLIAVSGGLHHIFAPGDKYPRFFKKISISLEWTSIEEYLGQFKQMSGNEKKLTVVKDLERKRDLALAELSNLK